MQQNFLDEKKKYNFKNILLVLFQKIIEKRFKEYILFKYIYAI